MTLPVIRVGLSAVVASADPVGVGVVAGWHIPVARVSAADAMIAQGVPQGGSVALSWGVPVPISAFVGAGSVAASVNLWAATALPWGVPQPIDTANRYLLGATSEHYGQRWALDIHQPAVHDSGVALPQLAVSLYSNRPSEYDLRQRDLLTSLTGDFDLITGPYIPSARFEFGTYRLTDLPAQPVSSAASFGARTPPKKEGDVALPWGVGQSLYYTPTLPYLVEPPIIPGGPIPEPNAREVHIIVNSVNVVSLPDNTPLAVADIKMNLDADSVSWKLSCEILNEASIALVKPDALGNKEIAITINGHTWVFFIATWGRSRSISGNQLDKRFSVSGYSRSQYLGLPYAPKRTRSIGTTTAVQATTDELVGTGFTLSWNTSDLPDWSMPNAVFSYQEQTPLQVIKRLATTAGAVVQPAIDSDVLTVRPRYWPVPWELAASTMDKTIHQSQILSEGGQLEYREKINAVFVSGESEGVAATITRQSTAGDTPGADVVEAWLTSIEANTSRGRQEIAAGGDRVIHSLELAIPEGSAEPGLLLPGHSVAVVYDDAARSYRGYVTAVGISVPGRGLAKVRQTVTVEQPVGWEE